MTQGSAPGDRVPTVTLPSLAPGASVTITFAAQIDSSLPPSVTQVSSQAFTSGSNFALDASDDPKTPEIDDDPTITRLHTPSAADVPTLGTAGLALLVIGLGLIGLRRLRRPALPAREI